MASWSGGAVLGRLRLSERILLLIAVVTSAAMPLVFAFAPTYSGVSTTADPVTGQSVTVTSSATMTEINGMWVLWYAFVPLVVTLAVAAILMLRDPERGPGVVGWVLVAVFLAFSVVGGFSLGLMFVPVAGCLLAVVITRQLGRR